MTNDMRFPRVVDATMRAAFLHCRRQFYWSHLRHMVPDRPSIDLHFGAAFAAGLEHTRRAYFGDGLSDTAALAAGTRALLAAWGDAPEESPVSPNKTLANCAASLAAYWDHWPLSRTGLVPQKWPDGQLGVELRLWANTGIPHPDGGHVYYAGRYDALLHDTEAPAAVLPCDEKTTTRLGDQFASKWRMRGQFLGYLWLTQQLGLRAHSLIVRGVGVLKHTTEFAEVHVSPPQWQIDTWHAQMLQDIRAMLASWRAADYGQNFGDACNAYRGCPYLMLCESAQPEEWLPTNYAQRVWDPLAP